MKKKISVIAILLVLVVVLSVTLAACGQKMLIGKKYVPSTDQISILRELKSGTVDVGIMDSVLANSYTKMEGAEYNDLAVVPNLVLAEEEYGIAAKKGSSSLIEEVWFQLSVLKKEGTLKTIAQKYGLEDELLIPDSYTKKATTDDSLEKIKAKGSLVVGWTEFKPIAYVEGKEFVGFDTDLAKAVCSKIGVTFSPIKIEWSQKEMEIKSNTIDLIWNGMTITEERKVEFEMTPGYLNNKQVAVVKKVNLEKYATKDKMKRAIISAEAGSAGEAFVIEVKK